MTGRCMSRKDGACCRLHEGHRDSHENWYGERWDDGDAAVGDMRPADAQGTHADKLRAFAAELASSTLAGWPPVERGTGALLDRVQELRAAASALDAMTAKCASLQAQIVATAWVRHADPVEP
jgi:hypothetical protein